MGEREKTINAAEIDFTICIPSYKRANRQKTLDFLQQLGIPKEKILVFVQTKEDERAYKEAGVEEKAGKIIYRHGNSVAENRNNILDYFGRGEKIVMMDDDVYKICHLMIGEKTAKRKLRDIQTGDELIKICEKGFALAELYKTVAWALNTYSNPLYMGKGYHTYKNINFQVGGVINTDMRFDPEFALYEDSEFCARVLKRYEAAICIDDYAAKYDKRAPGGCQDEWKRSAKTDKYTTMFMKKHGDLYDINPKRENVFQLKKGRKRG